MSTGLANFLSGGLSSFAFWSMAIPADNIKKCDVLESRYFFSANTVELLLAA